MTVKCPCENCLVKPRCRNRNYHVLYKKCEPLETFLAMNRSLGEYHRLHKERVRILEKTLNSHVWKLGGETPGGYHLIER